MSARKPTRLKVLAGNPGRRPLPEAEPEPRGAVVMPDWLSAGARLLWQAYAPEMIRTGLLTCLDVQSMGHWCECAATVEECTGVVESEGMLVSVHGQTVPNPAISLRAKAMTQARQLAAVLGLTPSARAGLGVAPPAEENGFLAWQREHGK